MRKYLPTALTVVILSTAVGVLHAVWSWSNTATNLATLGVVCVAMAVFARTAVTDRAPRKRA